MILTAISVLVICVVTALVLALFTRRTREEGRSDESKRHDGVHDQHPRRIVFKICPDCRELVFLDVSTCKYCGCTLSVAEVKEHDAAADAQKKNA